MLDNRLAHAGVVSSGEVDSTACSRTRQARDPRAPARVLGRRGNAPWYRLFGLTMDAHCHVIGFPDMLDLLMQSAGSRWIEVQRSG